MNDLPSGWKIARLEEVADTALGKMLDRSKSKGHPAVPYLRNVNVQWGKIDTDDLLTMEIPPEQVERFTVRQGDLLVCEGGEIGRAAIWNRPDTIAYQKALHRVRSKGPLVLAYLRYLLEFYSNSGLLARFATGSTIAHLPQEQLRALPVPLPPFEEQRRIVEILEDHLSRLDAAARFMQRAERKLRSLRRAQMQRIVASPKTGRLSDLVERIEAGKSFRAATRAARDGEWGIIKVSAMTWGEFRADQNKAVLEESFIDPRFEICDGDVLVSRANTPEYIGAPVFVRHPPPRLLLSDKSLRLVPRPGVNAEWLYRVLSAPSSRRQMTALATGTKESMRNISQASLLSVEVPIVDEVRQAEVVRTAHELDRVLSRMSTALADADKRARALRAALLAAAFSGGLTERTNVDVEEMAGV